MTFELGVSRVLFHFIDGEKEFNVGFSKIVGEVLQGDFRNSADEAVRCLC
jgi:hypothetical protein